MAAPSKTSLTFAGLDIVKDSLSQECTRVSSVEERLGWVLRSDGDGLRVREGANTFQLP